MATHVVPVTEPDLHIDDADCICEPMFFLDKESGEMVWAHQLLDYERLLKNFIQIT
jgi:hypothetical protein